MLGELHERAKRSIASKIGESRNQQDRNSDLVFTLEECLTELNRTLTSTRLLQESQFVENHRFRISFEDYLDTISFEEMRSKLALKIKRTKQFNLEIDIFREEQRVYEEDRSFLEQIRNEEATPAISSKKDITDNDIIVQLTDRETKYDEKLKNSFSKKMALAARLQSKAKPLEAKSAAKRVSRRKNQTTLDELEKTDKLIDELRLQPQKTMQKRTSG